MIEEVNLFAESDSEAPDGIRFFIVPERYRWYSNEDQINIGKVTINYSAPTNLTADEIRLMAIRTLQEKQERVIAEAYVRKEELQEKINELLRLTHQPESIVETARDSTHVENGLPF